MSLYEQKNSQSLEAFKLQYSFGKRETIKKLLFCVHGLSIWAPDVVKSNHIVTVANCS